MNNICKVASAKIKCSGKIKSRLNLSQAKNSFLSCLSSTTVAFSGCSVVKHCKINKSNTKKRALRIMYNEPNLNLDKLADLTRSTIHINNVITLLTEVHKTTRMENPIFMNRIFNQKKHYYNLQITNLLNFPKDIGSCFRGTHLWNQVPDSIKNGTKRKMCQS